MTYYFYFDRGLFGGVFGIVPKDFWDKHKSMDDTVRKSNVENLPDGFWEAAEAYFRYAGKKEDGVKKLLAAGFLPLPKD